MSTIFNNESVLILLVTNTSSPYYMTTNVLVGCFGRQAPIPELALSITHVIVHFAL